MSRYDTWLAVSSDEAREAELLRRFGRCITCLDVADEDDGRCCYCRERTCRECDELIEHPDLDVCHACNAARLEYLNEQRGER